MIQHSPDIDLIDLISQENQNVPGLLNGNLLSGIREEAYQKLKKSGLPNSKNEEYRYFQIARKLKRSYTFKLVEKVDLSYDISSKLVAEPEAIHIVYLNGVYSKDHSVHIPDNSISITELKDDSPSTNGNLELLEKKHQNINNDSYIDFNSAFLNTGTCITIKKNTISRSIYLYHFFTEDVKDHIINRKNIIVLETNSKVNISEIFFSDTKNHYFSNQVSEIFVNDDAKLEYCIIQELGDDAIHIQNTNIYQSSNSLTNTYTYSLKGAYVRNNLNILLNDEHCESHLYGLYYPVGKDLIDNHTTVDHRKANCYSNELYKGLIDDNSIAVFNGKIFVRPNAQKTNAFQSNKNLLLSDSATINTKPQLEIWADDVKCSHGATTGQIDEEQLFYLRSRGLDARTAKALLLHAFAFEIIDKIESQILRKFIGDKINSRLGYQFSD